MLRTPFAGHFSRHGDPSLGVQFDKGWAGEFTTFGGPISTHNESGTVCVGSARIDNRGELITQLALTSQATDLELLHHAYLKWHDDCAERIFGDWSFAVWDRESRELFVARDHFGFTSIFYYLDDDQFAFASDLGVLLEMGLVAPSVNELFIAHRLTSWPQTDGGITAYNDVHRLPPAHLMTVNPTTVSIRQYWYLERTPELVLTDPREYAEGLRNIFRDAVTARLRRDGGTVASGLSGGLDSSSVTAMAARILDQTGEGLDAYTSVPIADTSAFVPTRFGDELPMAKATAGQYLNIRLHAVDAAEVSPIAAIRQELAFTKEPGHAAGNSYWLLALDQAAAAAGASVLLVGQHGNSGFSWNGSVFSQPLSYQLSNLGAKGFVRTRGMRALPPSAVRWRRRRHTHERMFSGTALNPEFAARIDLITLLAQDPSRNPARTVNEERSWLGPGISSTGSLWAAHSRAAGIDITDPTADARLLAYAWSIPDRHFIDPATGVTRKVIRDAMAGVIPDEVRLNQKRGRQAADLPVRLRLVASEVEDAISQIEAGSGAQYVSPERLRSAWKLIQTQDSPQAYDLSVKNLTRGLMVGIFASEVANG